LLSEERRRTTGLFTLRSLPVEAPTRAMNALEPWLAVAPGSRNSPIKLDPP